MLTIPLLKYLVTCFAIQKLVVVLVSAQLVRLGGCGCKNNFFFKDLAATAAEIFLLNNWTGFSSTILRILSNKITNINFVFLGYLE